MPLRYALIEDEPPARTRLKRLLSELAPELKDPERLAAKLRRDQQKLLALVQFIRYDGDKKEYLRNYFGLTD